MTFLISVSKTRMPNSFDWRTCFSFSAILRPQPFELVRVTVQYNADSSGQPYRLLARIHSPWIGTRFIFLFLHAIQIWLRIIAGELLICAWPAVPVPYPNCQGSIPIFRSMAMQNEWGSILEPTKSMRAPNHSNRLFGNLRDFWWDSGFRVNWTSSWRLCT